MDILQPLVTAQLLVLDDVGKEKTSEWVEETMTFIVNSRYNQRLVTIFTSNYEDTPDIDVLDSLRVRVGSRMYSRMHEMCDFIEYGGADYRLLPPNPERRRSHGTLEGRRRAEEQAAVPRQGPGPRPAQGPARS